MQLNSYYHYIGIHLSVLTKRHVEISQAFVAGEKHRGVVILAVVSKTTQHGMLCDRSAEVGMYSIPKLCPAHIPSLRFFIYAVLSISPVLLLTVYLLIPGILKTHTISALPSYFSPSRFSPFSAPSYASLQLPSAPRLLPSLAPLYSLALLVLQARSFPLLAPLVDITTSNTGSHPLPLTASKSCSQ